MKKNLFIFLSAIVVLVSGCSTDYEILKSVEAIVLTADSSARIVGEPITFTVRNNNGDDLTGEAAIYVNGNAITGNTYTSNAVGNFEAKATYLGVESNAVVINFHNGAEVNFVKNVLIEDYTGTWCGYCPRVAHAVEMVKEQTGNVVAVGIHRASDSPTDPSYDPYNYDTTELENIIDVPGYPKGMLNRMTQWNFPEPSNITQVIALTQGENPKLGLAMASTVAGGNINLEVKTKFSKDFNNVKLVVYVLENDLVHDQHNYTGYYGGEAIIPNFVHNHVLRACLTPLMGEVVNSNESATGNTYTRTFSIPVPAKVANAANIEFVAFIVDADGNAINVRKAAPGENQDFEEL